MEVTIVLEECLSTDGNYSSNAWVMKSAQEAGEFATCLVADMCAKMDVPFFDGTKFECSGDGWWYRVRLIEDNI